MKILHIYSGTYTGGGIIKKMINLITNDSSNNHELYFIWYSDPQGKRYDMMAYLNDLQVEYRYTYHKSIWFNIPDLYRHLKRNNYDVIHFYTDNVMILGKIVQLMGIKQKYVRSFEGAPMYTKFPQKQLVNWALTSCRNFASISKYVKSSYTQIYPSLKGTNQVVIYNTLVHKMQRHTCITDREGIICVGTLTDQKQFDVAIKAISIIKAKYDKEIPLYILGNGNDKDKLRALAKKLDIENLIHFEGVINNPEAYYDRCKLFIHPAYNEGFGLVVLEAMMMELGVIVSNSGALSEIIEDGQTGYILPLKKPEIWAEKINEFYINNSLIEKMGRKAHNVVVTRFSLHRHIDNYINFYKQTIG